ncbi:hypothetical protein ACHAXN_002318 [Cyclotella atomus]
MADEEERKKKKKKDKKKKSSRREREPDDEENVSLPIESGEAEFANEAAVQVVAADPDDPNNEVIPSSIPEDPQEGGLFSEDGLAVAMAVDTTAEDEFIYAAVEYDPDSKPPLYKNRRFRVYSCIALVIILSVTVVVAVYITKSTKADEIVNLNVDYTPPPTTSPTSAPTTNREASGIKEQIEAGVLQRGVTFQDLDKKKDPRWLALDWILFKDQMQLQSNDKNLYQRYIMALLAFSLDSLAWKSCGEHREFDPKFGNLTGEYIVENCTVLDITGEEEEHGVWLSSTPECTWYGAICSSDDVLRGLQLIGNSLIGEIPPEISQLRFLQFLALNGNCLYGNIPPELSSMPNLLSLELQGNGLSGSMPEEMYDATKLQLLNVAMQYEYNDKCQRSNSSYVYTLYAKGNPDNGYNWGLTGNVLGNHTSNWKSMKGLHLFDNSFTGQIDDAISELKYLVFLRAHNNQFWGLLPNGMTYLNKLREVYLNTNSLWSDLPPDVGMMEDLEDIRLGENRMYGTIPDSFYNLVKMKKIWFQDTVECSNVTDDCEASSVEGFEGSLQSEIGNMKDLSMLVINNNPLTGTLPAQLGNCEQLSLIHIHQTNIEGTVPKSVCQLRDKMLNTESSSGIFYADCRPNNKTGDPFFTCSCCTDCCDHTTKVCVADD